MMNTLESLNWRYATKKFDANRTLTDVQVDQLLEAGNLAASSYGLQPYKLLVIKNHCLLYTSPSPRDLSTSRMPSSA